MIFTKQEMEIIQNLAETWTGTHIEDDERRDYFARNVARRMVATQANTLQQYLQFLKLHPQEREHLLSGLTIHTTSWFRERPHFQQLQRYIQLALQHGRKKFRIWVAACSTGEEVYSVGLFLEELRNAKGTEPDFDYRILGTDIDPISVKSAQRAIYPVEYLSDIDFPYRRWIRVGTNALKEYFAVGPEVRGKCEFRTSNLLGPVELGFSDENKSKDQLAEWDIILCRNVLIYFPYQQTLDIVERLGESLKPEGLLILGHSEALHTPPAHLLSSGPSCYLRAASKMKLKELLISSVFKTKNKSPSTSPMAMDSVSADKRSQAKNLKKRKKVLIIDDSPLISASIRRILEPLDFEVSNCETSEDATRALMHTAFDLITLDLNLPGENGASWLVRNRQLGLVTPVVIVSDSSPSEAEKTFGVLFEGAQDYITKSRLGEDPDLIGKTLSAIANKQKMVQESRLHHLKKFNYKAFQPEVILIGASTGGPDAIVRLISNLPQPCPPVIVVQHILHQFSRAFAVRLVKTSGLALGEIEVGTSLKANTIYMAQGDYHIGLRRGGDFGLTLDISTAQPEFRQRPSVNYLFQSAAKIKAQALSLLLTGMGEDGAQGMLQLFKVGSGFNLAQDEASCIVYGMPKKAVDLGGVHSQGGLTDLRQILFEVIKNANLMRLTPKAQQQTATGAKAQGAGNSSNVTNAHARPKAKKLPGAA